jgi:hypothetical protein
VQIVGKNRGTVFINSIQFEEPDVPGTCRCKDSVAEILSLSGHELESMGKLGAKR